MVSWGWNRGSEVDTLLDLGASTSRFVDEQEWQGTRDPAAYLSIPSAIQFQAEHDWPRVRAECHELLRETRRRIEALTGLAPICPDSPEWYAQTAAFPLPACDAAGLQRWLWEKYRIEVPVIEWPVLCRPGTGGGQQLVRVSVQGYNTAEDVEVLVSALVKLLAPR